MDVKVDGAEWKEDILRVDQWHMQPLVENADVPEQFWTINMHDLFWNTHFYSSNTHTHTHTHTRGGGDAAV